MLPKNNHFGYGYSLKKGTFDDLMNKYDQKKRNYIICNNIDVDKVFIADMRSKIHNRML